MSQPNKKAARASHTSKGLTESAEGKGRPYVPNKASVLSEKEFTSPTGKRYRITRTDEKDPYDAPGNSNKQPGGRDNP